MKNNLMILIQNYLNLFQNEANSLGLLKKQIEEKQDIFSRKNFKGHITASGLVITVDKKILTIFHNELKNYFLPGGHIELLDASIISAAKREVIEETNLKNIRLHDWCLQNNSPILIDTHKIPENILKNETTHFHHDFMFIFNALETDICLDKNEVSSFNWANMNDLIKENSNISNALKKMVTLNLI